MDTGILGKYNGMGISGDTIMELIENKDKTWTCIKCRKIFQSRIGGRHKDPSRVAFFKAIYHSC